MTTRTVCTALTLAVCFATSAMAQDRNDHDNRREDDRQHEMNRAPQREEMAHERHEDARDHERGRGAGPRHDFYRGGRLPGEFRNRQYVVDNWREHRLSAPPRGYHWVQTGADYVLVAIATGVIAQVLLGQ